MRTNKGLLFVVILLAAMAASASDPRQCGAPERNEDGAIARSTAVVNQFRKMYPCPVTGKTEGACPGWSVDHVIPLASCGCDSVGNMQWLPNTIKTAPGVDAKDRWERRVYVCPVGNA